MVANETSDATFKDDILTNKKQVLVDFWAPWCGPCRILEPVMNKIAEKIAGRSEVYKLNVDKSPLAAQAYGITGIPTVVLFRAGRVVQKFVGVQPEQTYLDALDR